MALLHICDHFISKLRAKPQMMDHMGEGVRLILEVVLQIMHMQIAIREALARGNMEIANDLVHADATFEAAPFLALLIEVFGVMFALALFDALAAPKGPRDRSVSVAHLVTSVATSGLGGVSGSGSAITFSTVAWIEMLGLVFVPTSDVSTWAHSSAAWGLSLQFQRLNLDNLAPFIFGTQPNLIDPMSNAHLDLARDIHDI